MPIPQSKLVNYEPDNTTICLNQQNQLTLCFKTENIPLIYLDIIGKGKVAACYRSYYYCLLSNIGFTDKQVRATARGAGSVLAARYLDPVNAYLYEFYYARPTRDIEIVKIYQDIAMILAREAIDIGIYFTYFAKFQVVGSSLVAARSALNPLGDIFTIDYVNILTATDTDFAVGDYGYSFLPPYYYTAPNYGYLMPVESATPKPQILIDAEVTGKGSLDDPYMPSLPQDLIEVDPSNLPRDLAEAVRDNPKGPNGLPLVDRLAVTWGVFEARPEKEPTVVITITGSNPYYDRAIEKVVDHARSKGYRVLKPPRDYREAADVYKIFRRDHPEWLAGKDNFAYQTLGHEAFEAFQAADFYYGNLVEHRKHYQALKRVPDWELRRTIESWIKRLERVNVLTEERDKHHRKLKKVLSLGW